MGDHSPYVFRRSFRGKGEEGGPGADCVQAQQEVGDCLEYLLFEAVGVRKKDGVIYPRRHPDYTVRIHEE